jgi:hypothetical protein
MSLEHSVEEMAQCRERQPSKKKVSDMVYKGALFGRRIATKNNKLKLFLEWRWAAHSEPGTRVATPGTNAQVPLESR